MQALVTFHCDLSAVSVSNTDDPTSEIELFVLQKYGLPEGSVWVTEHGQLYMAHLRVCGGKGGFGRAMKQEGERRSRRLPHHKDSCKTVTGRRIGVLKARKRIRELKQKIKEEEDARTAEKTNAKRSQLERDLSAVEQRQYELSESMRDAVSKGIETDKKAPTQAPLPSAEEAFELLYGATEKE